MASTFHIGTLTWPAAPPYIIRYDAQSLPLSTADGSTQTTLFDQSGNGYNVTGQCFYYSMQPQQMINDHPSFQFGGFNPEFFSGTGPTPNQPLTIFMVVKNALTSGTEFIFGSAGTGAVQSSYVANGSTPTGFVASAGSNLGTNTTDTSWHYVTIQYNGTTSSIRVDGVTVATGVTGAGAFTGGIRVGGISSASPGPFYNGLIGELILVGPCTTGQVNYVEALLYNKWLLDDPPIYRSSSQNFSLLASPVTSLTVPTPAGVQEGDIIVACNYSTTTDLSGSASGWNTVLSTSIPGSGGYAAELQWRVATATEPASYTFGPQASGGAAVILSAYSRCSGVDNGAYGQVRPGTTISYQTVHAYNDKRIWGSSFFSPNSTTVPLPTGWTTRFSATAGGALIAAQEDLTSVNTGTYSTSASVPVSADLYTLGYTLR